MKEKNVKSILQILKNDIHSTTVATVSDDFKPEVRTIDIMLADENTIYFITARGKNFYERLINQKYVAINGVKNGIGITIKGNVETAPKELLEKVFEENIYLKDIYPEGTRDILEVFCIRNGQGEYIDLNITPFYRQVFTLGDYKVKRNYYQINKNCIKCDTCVEKCPTSCILKTQQYEIQQNTCVHCGTCKTVCRFNAIDLIKE